MATILDEGLHRYTFSADWHVNRYDNVGIHKKMSSALSGVKAVDFVGHHSDFVCLIEVKDFRGFRIANKARLKSGDLATEVAEKVLHSVPGLTAESRSGLASAIGKSGKKVPKKEVRLVVVLHIEDDTAVNSDAWKQQLDTQAKLIEKKLNWLPCKVVVTSTKAGFKLPDVTVSNLPI